MMNKYIRQPFILFFSLMLMVFLISNIGHTQESDMNSWKDKQKQEWIKEHKITTAELINQSLSDLLTSGAKYLGGIPSLGVLLEKDGKYIQCELRIKDEMLDGKISTSQCYRLN